MQRVKERGNQGIISRGEIRDMDTSTWQGAMEELNYFIESRTLAREVERLCF